MADKGPADRSDEMEHDLERLGEHISDAEQRLEERRKDADPAQVAGDWEGEQAIGGGDDPVGAADEAGDDDDSDGGDASDGGDESGGDDEDDDRVDEEVANPT